MKIYFSYNGITMWNIQVIKNQYILDQTKTNVKFKKIMEKEELNEIANHFTELYSDEIKNNEITKDTIHEWWNYTKDQYSKNIEYQMVEKAIKSLLS